MIKIKLPVQSKEIDNGKILVKKTEKEFIVDTSIASQMRFETKFPELAVQGDLFDYIERVQESDINVAKLAVALSQLKVVYCLFVTDMTYIDFLQLFDLSDSEYALNLLNKIKEILQLALSGSCEKN